jgi:hypothetical protein
MERSYHQSPRSTGCVFDSRGRNGNDNVLSGQFGKVDLLLQRVDLDVNIGSGITSLDWGGSDEGGESLVGGLSGSGE